ncbi:MAG TPA: hypothetical protein VMW01_04075 [Williamwhitmania sp.]|nr:hypothetical protein [Williamwhitmania sp.]
MRKELCYLVAAVFLTFFAVGGCATQNLDIVDQGGRQIPTPHYIMKSLDKSVSVLFYYTAISTEKDLDGYEVPISKHLALNQQNYISMKKYKTIMVSLEVQNPTNQEYSIWEMIQWKSNGGIDEARGQRVGKSNRSYRSYTIQLPYDEKYKNVKYTLQLLSSGGKTLMFLGEFKYSTD